MGFFISYVSDVVIVLNLVVVPPLENGVNAICHELHIKIEEIHSEKHCKYAACAAKCDKRNFSYFFHCYFSFLTMHAHRA